MKDSIKNKISNLFNNKTPERKSFKSRVSTFWQVFGEEEAKIRQLMIDKADGNTLVKAMTEILDIAFVDIPFEMGINDENKHELILSPNGNRVLLIQILYLLKYRPEHLNEKWNFYSSKPAQGTEGMELNIYDIKITAGDFLVYTNLEEERKIINIDVFVPIMMELDENKKYNALFIMLDLFIGELYTMEYIGKIDIIENKKSDEYEQIPLTKLKSYIDYLVNEHDWEKTKHITENYIGYKADGIENSKELRKDAYVGYTSCFDIIRDLGEENIYPIKQLEDDGVYMAYIFYNNSTIDQENMVPQRAEIEDAILDLIEDEGIAQSTGGATGYDNSYIDFIIYDLDAFIPIAKKIMKSYKFESKGIGFFESNEKTILF